MSNQHNASPGAASAASVPSTVVKPWPREWPEPYPGRPEAAAAPPPESPPDPPDAPPARVGWWEGHMPELVDPLEPNDPETSFTETRHLRHDGWTPEKMRRFHERLAECGVVKEACEAAGMSARSAYNLRDRDPVFAAGWEAACVKARPRLADEAFSRSMNGVVERIYRDGMVVAERHRYDNRLTMAVLNRLDSRLDRAEHRGSPHLAVAEHWDEYLAALGEGRREDAMALLAPPVEAAAGPRENAPDSELRELQGGGEAGMLQGIDADRHLVWQQDGQMWTDYPPPEDFYGDERGGEYGDAEYRRSLSPAEQAAIDAEEGAGGAADLALAEVQRDTFFFGGAADESADGLGAGSLESGASPPSVSA